MKDYLEEYLKIQSSHKKNYLLHNKLIKADDTIEDLFYYINDDLDLVFRLLHVMPNKIGFKYWKDSVFIYILSEKNKVNICKEIYPYVAQKYNKSENSIERAMRLCFEKTLFNISKYKDNLVSNYMKDYLTFSHNSKILSKIVELICSKNFQSQKEKLNDLDT